MYAYTGGRFDLVGVDPRSGRFEVWPSPSRGAVAAVAVAGKDGKIYLGTRPGAQLMALDPAAGRLSVLGRPDPRETYIWAIDVGPDGKVYAGTYPSAELVSYDPRTRRFENLGRMDPSEQYARAVVADTDGFVYVGVGPQRAHVVAYSTQTKSRRDLLRGPPEALIFPLVYRGADGRVYARVRRQLFVLRGGTATPVSTVPPEGAPKLRTGETVTIDAGEIVLGDAGTGQKTKLRSSYAGRPLQVWSLGALGSEVYGSTASPLYLFRLSRAAPTLARLDSGEAYSFLARDGKLLIGAYGGQAPLLVYDPKAPQSPDNPRPVRYPGDNLSWRPWTQIDGPDGRVYIGSTAGYGIAGGELTVWNTQTGSFSKHHPVDGQSILSLAATGQLVVGGSSLASGGGAPTSRGPVQIFVWDTRKNAAVYRQTIPRAEAILSLATAKSGVVYGFADRRLVVVDVNRRRVALGRTTRLHPLRGALFADPAGRIWGVAREGVFSGSLRDGRTKLVARAPAPATGAATRTDTALFFAAGASVYRFRFPSP